MKSQVLQVAENINSATRRGIGSLRFFAIGGLIAFVVVAFLMVYLFRTLAVDGLIKVTEVEHVKLAQLIGNETWDDIFGPWILATQGKSAQELRAAPELPAIERKIKLMLKGTRVCKIKAYDLKGKTIYSTDPDQIGQDKRGSPGVTAGLLGFSNANLVHRDQTSFLECEVQTRDLVETYVPHFSRATGKVTGVFEIYGDATQVLAEIKRQEWTLLFVVIGPLALLYLAMFFIIKQSQDAFLRCIRERKGTASSLVKPAAHSRA